MNLLLVVFMAFIAHLVHATGTPSSNQASNNANSNLCPALKFNHELVSNVGANSNLLTSSSSSDNTQSFKLTFSPFAYENPQLAVSRLMGEFNQQMPVITSTPLVDWVDVHYTINNGIQQNVRMNLVAGSDGPMAASPTHDAAVAARELIRLQSTGGIKQQQWAIPNIELKVGDTIEYSFTYCVNMIDCNTETQRKTIAAPAAQQQKVTNEQSCPVIQWTHKVDCDDVSCQVTFLNLGPQYADWVDVHISSSAQLATPGTTMLMDNLRMQLSEGLRASSMQVQAMKLGSDTNQSPLEHAFHKMESPLSSDHTDQVHTRVQVAPIEGALGTSGALSTDRTPVQVFVQPGRTSLSAGSRLSFFFTYCVMGTDCDTNTFVYSIEAPTQPVVQPSSSQKKPSPPQPVVQPSQPQQKKPAQPAQPVVQQQKAPAQPVVQTPSNQQKKPANINIAASASSSSSISQSIN